LPKRNFDKNFLQVFASAPETQHFSRYRPSPNCLSEFPYWKDADPDIPIYKQAKAEYAKIRRNLRVLYMNSPHARDSGATIAWNLPAFTS
jgi:hypothetical protein